MKRIYVGNLQRRVGTADELVLPLLVRKRADLAGEMERTPEALKRMLRDLDSIDATVRIFDPPQVEIEAIKPRRFVLPPIGPSGARRLATPASDARGAGDGQQRQTAPPALHQARRPGLRHQRDAGSVVSHEGPAHYSYNPRKAYADGAVAPDHPSSCAIVTRNFLSNSLTI
jgi:hypothetical protein